MRLVVISASNRAGSESLKVANWLVKHANNLGMVAETLDLFELGLPMYDDAEHNELNQKVSDLKQQLAAADGFIFVSPEWNGMMSLTLPNMLHYVSQELANKPVMLVGVSAGKGGTHPIGQMRLMGPKNRHYVISPENLIVSGVEQAFNDYEWSDDRPDIALKQRADYSLKILFEYMKALQNVRQSGVVDYKRFGNGV
jgi:NAD(P)H-dependent FMN reductase